jgi:DUF4097 and DUF4098 domain-containing protein YvlB
MYSRFRQLVQVSALMFVAVGVSGCDIAVDGHGGLNFDFAGKAQDEWSRTYTVAAGGRFELINVNGQISAEATDGAAIEVKAERSAKAGSDDAAREMLGKIEMREEVGEGRVRVEVRVPRFSGGEHQVKWTVKVPRGTAVDLRTVNGGVKLDRLQGDIRARTTNGGITGSALQPTGLDAAVTNGGVVIELATAISSGTFQIEAVNGGIELRLPPDSKADITGRCVNGGIAVNDLPVATIGEQSRRRLEGTLNGGGAKITLETVNGGLRLLKTVSTT